MTTTPRHNTTTTIAELDSAHSPCDYSLRYVPPCSGRLGIMSISSHFPERIVRLLRRRQQGRSGRYPHFLCAFPGFVCIDDRLSCCSSDRTRVPEHGAVEVRGRAGWSSTVSRTGRAEFSLDHFVPFQDLLVLHAAPNGNPPRSATTLGRECCLAGTACSECRIEAWCAVATSACEV